MKWPEVTQPSGADVRRVRQETEVRVTSALLPFEVSNVAAAGAVDVFTVPTGEYYEIVAATYYAIGAGTLRINVLADGATSSTGTQIVNRTVASGESGALPEVVGHVVGPGNDFRFRPVSGEMNLLVSVRRHFTGQ